VFENRVLRRIFGARRHEVTGDWRKLHNEELHKLYSSPILIRMIKPRRIRWAGYVARMGETRNAHRILVEKTERKRPLGRPRRRWVDNIKMDLREIARVRETRNEYRILVGKPEGKRPLGRPRRRWVDNIKMDLK
jgi:hypothetical protein